MLALRMIGPHFSISARTKAANSSGVLGRLVTEREVRRALMAGSLIASFRALLSRATTASGVPAGTKTPFHSSAW